MSTERASGRQLFRRHPNLRRYLLGRFLAGTASQVQTVAVGWQVFQLTGDPFDLGLVALSQFLPFVLLILPAGHVADRYDRARVQLATYLVLAISASALLALAVAGVEDPGPIFGVMVLSGVARAFNQPTAQALLPNVSPPGTLPQTMAIQSSLGQVATIAGPAIGGVVVLFGVGLAFALATALFIGAIAFAIGIRVADRIEAPIELSWRSLVSGITFVGSRSVILGSISLDLFAVLFGGTEALLPIYAGEILGVGPAGLGVMRAAPAIGAAIVAVVLTIRPIRRHVGRWMFAGVAIFGMSTMLFGASTSFALSLAALVVMGAADLVSVYIRHLLVQLETPDAIRGRVSAVNAVFIGASNELGEFESGITASWWGVVPAVVVGGVATMAVAGVWARLFPVLWRLDRFPGVRTDGR